MTQLIHLLLEVPAEHGTDSNNAPEVHADLQRLLAKSRLRIISGKASHGVRQAVSKNSPPITPQGSNPYEAVKSLEEVERDYIVEILSRSDGNRSKAAKMLNISRRTLQRKMAQFS